MLILTRKSGENIQIGDNITISVFRTNKQRVRLGIEAPRSISVRREEIAMEDIPGLHRAGAPDASIDAGIMAAFI